MFSQTAEYALRAVVCLADGDPRPRTAQDLAARTQVPRDYLSKVMQALGRANIVRAQRGKNGGFSLARPPKELTIFDVVDCVDPVPRIDRCPLGLRAHQGTLCPLHRRLDAAMQKIEQEFKQASIAQLLRPGAGVKPLCEIAEVSLAS